MGRRTQLCWVIIFHSVVVILIWTATFCAPELLRIPLLNPLYFFIFFSTLVSPIIATGAFIWKYQWNWFAYPALLLSMIALLANLIGGFYWIAVRSTAP